MARPSKLTDEVLATITSLIENGNYLETAAQASSVTVRTLQNWMRWGSDADAAGLDGVEVPESSVIYAEFFREVTRARAQAEIDMVATIRNPPTDSDGRTDRGWVSAVQWLLERTRRDRFGAKIELYQRAEETFRDVVERALPRLRAELDPNAYVTTVRILLGECAEGGPGEGEATGTPSH